MAVSVVSRQWSVGADWASGRFPLPKGEGRVRCSNSKKPGAETSGVDGVSHLSHDHDWLRASGFWSAVTCLRFSENSQSGDESPQSTAQYEPPVISPYASALGV